jgi:hypothetical protein
LPFAYAQRLFRVHLYRHSNTIHIAK